MRQYIYKLGVGASLALAVVGASTAVYSQSTDPAVTELTPVPGADQDDDDDDEAGVIDGENAAETPSNGVPQDQLPSPAGPEVEQERSFFGPALALLGLAGAGGTAAALAAGGTNASPQ